MNHPRRRGATMPYPRIMRRVLDWRTRTVGLLVALLAATAPALAQDAGSTPAVGDADLPVTRLVLFTNGVGYFEHSGTVSGTQELRFDVPTDQMDDLLQSLVLQDFDGGTIAPVRYASSDPLSRILRSYALDLSGDPTLAELLAQARGEAVQLTAAEPMRGVLVNVESVAQPDGAAPRTFLTLSTERGLERLPLDEVRDLRFERASVQQDLEAALAALQQYRDGDAKPVRLRFSGEGERRVRVGYVREMPVWKTSYRMVLGGDGRADLQAWAIADNPTDTDLRDVRISFVAGQPISFVTDLYAPVYVARPHVAVRTAPSVVPRADSGSSAPAAMESARSATAPAAMADAFAGAAPPEAPKLQGAGVSAMAQGVDLGATFAYQVDEPVTIARHESAMIPIVQQAVQVRPLSLFDPAVLPRHPLTSVRLVNDTGLHLAAGPVSMFDAGGFAGNAQLSDVVPGDSRILTYAVDLELTVDPQRDTGPERITAVTFANGVLVSTVKQRLTTRYRVASEGQDARFLVIAHAAQAGYDITAPDPAPARTEDGYRFGVALRSADGGAPEADPEVPTQVTCTVGAACTLEVVEERTDSRSVAVTNVTSEQIAFFLENVELSRDDRATLGRILEAKRQIADLTRQIEDAQARVDAIHQEQSRVRQNMGALDRNSSLYRRYVSDLESQENELAGLQKDLEALRSRRSGAQADLDALIAGLAPG